MSIFERMDRVTSRICDKSFDCRFHAYPSAGTPNGRPGPDPDREEWEGRAIFDEVPNLDSIEFSNRNRAGNDFQAMHAGNRYELSVDRHRFPLVLEAKQRDRVMLDDMRKFEVVETRRDGLARVVMVLVEIR